VRNGPQKYEGEQRIAYADEPEKEKSQAVGVLAALLLETELVE
jgi:hypothetical protein